MEQGSVWSATHVPGRGLGYRYVGRRSGASALAIGTRGCMFIEGFSSRFNEYPVSLNEGFVKYIVTLSDRELVFHKSETSKRWWIELINENYIDNKLKRSALLPCTQKDYKSACADELPQRWWKASKRG